MLYSEFLNGTGAADTQESYNEYKRVEAFYMACDGMTKEDVYRMAKVETVAQHEDKQRKARKEEAEWVKQNLISAAAYIRGMSEKLDYIRSGYRFTSECGNIWELRLERDVNYGSVMLYSLWLNGKQIELDESGYRLLPSAEFQSYRANWYNKSIEELKSLFGYIA